MRDFKKLQIWQRAHKLTLALYRVTEEFPDSELYRITSQIRRSSLSVPTNISEGCSRVSKKEFARFLEISFGSLSETEYLWLLCFELKFIDQSLYDQWNEEITELKSMIYSYRSKVLSSSS